MSVEALAGLFNSVPPTPVEETLTARDVAERMLLGDPVFDGALLRRAEEAEFSPRRKRAPKSSKVVAAPASKVAPAQFDVGQAQRAIAANCVGSLANDTYISSLFYYGGAGTTVYLCQNAVINLTNAIFFTSANQTLATIGFPTGSERATLVVTAADQSCAIYGAIDFADNIAIRNIQIDGARETLGIIYGGIAVMELGGNTNGQVIDNVHAYEGRGWSILHGIEGYDNYCTGMIITNNQIGPSGHAPSGAAQFRKRDNTGKCTPGQWADGISIACQASTVTGNVVTDATDGGIVIFGSPGTKVFGNTIQSVNRQLMGGINMVDWSPFSGSFLGTEVTGNTIIAQSNFIKLGIAMGGMTWGVDNQTVARTYGGLVEGNTFRSGPTGYFGYAIGIAGHENATVTENGAKQANFGSIESASCFTSWFPLPAPQSFINDEWTTPGCVLERGFFASTLVLLICRGPGPITAHGGLPTAA